MPPFLLPLGEAVRLTAYSLRRKLPSVADRLQLGEERRSEIGDWRDEVRYSAARLETSASTRRVCLAALATATRMGQMQDEMRLLGRQQTHASSSKQC